MAKRALRLYGRKLCKTLTLVNENRYGYESKIVQRFDILNL
ncbi:hypothetical protein C2W64_03570 [Brevibacillus laterosporus]|nr:hypothetical protein C2W64_03570 [Brevibacillus laterosporus]